MSNLTNTELQGSSTVFYCVPRNWIRLLKRTGQFFRILLSYPLYLVFWDSEVLKAGAPHLQILLLNLFLYYVPCALVMIMVRSWSTDKALTIGNNSTMVEYGTPMKDVSNRQYLLVWTFLVYLQLPVVYSIFRQLTLSRSKQKVASGTFCFRPAYRFRWNRSNLGAIGGILFEFVQHSYFCLPDQYIKRHTSATAVFELNIFGYRVGKQHQFWFTVGLVAFNALVLNLRVSIWGRAAHVLYNMSFVWLAVYFISGPLYVAIIVPLVRAVDCTTSPTIDGKVQDTSVPVLRWDPSLGACWQTEHTRMAWAGFTCLAVYITHATTLPSGTFKETMRSSQYDVLFVPLYLKWHFLLKGIFAVLYATVRTSSLEGEMSRVCLLVLINFSCLCLNLYMKPSSLSMVNRLRTATFTSACWIGISSLVALFPNRHLLFTDHNPEEIVINEILLVRMCLVGTAVILVYHVFAYHRYNTARQHIIVSCLRALGVTDIDIPSNNMNDEVLFTRLRSLTVSKAKADRTMKQQVKTRSVSHPRSLEQLVALTISMAERCKRMQQLLTRVAKHRTGDLATVPEGQKQREHAAVQLDKSEKEFMRKYKKDELFVYRAVLPSLHFLLTNAGKYSQRVQFQLCWIISNLALCEDLRCKLDNAQCIPVLFRIGTASRTRSGRTVDASDSGNNNVSDIADYPVSLALQKEALAACVNLLVEPSAVNHLIEYFHNIQAQQKQEDKNARSQGDIRGSKVEGALAALVRVLRTDLDLAPFASMLLRNIAQIPKYRSAMRREGAIPALATLALTNKAAYMVQAHSCYTLAMHALDDARHQSIYRAQGVAHRLLLSTRSVNGHKALAAMTLITNLSFHGFTSNFLGGKGNGGIENDNTTAGALLAAGALHRLNPLRYHADLRMRMRCRVAVHNLLQHLLHATFQQNVEIPREKIARNGNFSLGKRKSSVGQVTESFIRRSSSALEHGMAGVKWLNRRFSEALFDDETNAYSSSGLSEDTADNSLKKAKSEGKAIPPLARVRWHTWPSRLDSLEHMRALGSTRRMFVCTERGVPVNIVPISGHTFTSAEQLKDALVRSPKHGSLEAVVVRLVRKRKHQHRQPRHDHSGSSRKPKNRGAGSTVGPFESSQNGFSAKQGNTTQVAGATREDKDTSVHRNHQHKRHNNQAVRGEVVKTNSPYQNQDSGMVVFDSRGNVLTPSDVNHKRKQSIVAHSQRVKKVAQQHGPTNGKLRPAVTRNGQKKTMSDRDGDLIVRYRYKPEPGYVGQDSFSFRQPDQYSLLSSEDGDQENSLSRITRRQGKEVVVLVTVTQNESGGDIDDSAQTCGKEPQQKEKQPGFHFEPMPQQMNRANGSAGCEKELLIGLATCQYVLQVVVLQAKGVLTYPGLQPFVSLRVCKGRSLKARSKSLVFDHGSYCGAPLENVSGREQRTKVVGLAGRHPVFGETFQFPLNFESSGGLNDLTTEELQIRFRHSGAANLSAALPVGQVRVPIRSLVGMVADGLPIEPDSIDSSRSKQQPALGKAICLQYRMSKLRGRGCINWTPCKVAAGCCRICCCPCTACCCPIYSPIAEQSSLEAGTSLSQSYGELGLIELGISLFPRRQKHATNLVQPGSNHQDNSKILV